MQMNPQSRGVEIWFVEECHVKTNAYAWGLLGVSNIKAKERNWVFRKLTFKS